MWVRFSKAESDTTLLIIENSGVQYANFKFHNPGYQFITDWL